MLFVLNNNFKLLLIINKKADFGYYQSVSYSHNIKIQNNITSSTKNI